MPQMAPLPWLSLLLISSLLIILFMTILYFNFSYGVSTTNKTSFMSPSTTWKW
nr:ATPase subunit 8 [Branchinecta gaini]